MSCSLEYAVCAVRAVSFPKEERWEFFPAVSPRAPQSRGGHKVLQQFVPWARVGSCQEWKAGAMHDVQIISGCETGAVKWISLPANINCDCSSKMEHQTKLRPLGKVCAPKQDQQDSCVWEFRALHNAQVTYWALYVPSGFGVGTTEPGCSAIPHRWRESHLSSISLVQFLRASFTFYTFLWYHRTPYSCWQMECMVNQN